MSYAKQIPLRLHQQEVDELERLKETLNTTSDTATIRHIICNYAKLEKELREKKRENISLGEELRSLKDHLKKFFNSFHELKEMTENKKKRRTKKNESV